MKRLLVFWFLPVFIPPVSAAMRMALPDLECRRFGISSPCWEARTILPGGGVLYEPVLSALPSKLEPERSVWIAAECFTTIPPFCCPGDDARCGTTTTTRQNPGWSWIEPHPNHDFCDLREVLHAARDIPLFANDDTRTDNLLYFSPSARLRQEADAMDRHDAAVKRLQAALDACKGEP